MSDHTQGMLSVGPPYTNNGAREIPLMGGPDGLLFIAVAIGGLVGQEENARRIVAAWNACQGIPTDVLEAQHSGGLPWRLADQIEARVVWKQLLEALQECVEDSQEAVNVYVATYGEEWKPHRLAALRETVAKARAAIARATGGKT